MNNTNDIIASSKRCKSIHNVLYKWAYDTKNICLAERVTQGISTNYVYAKYPDYQHILEGRENHFKKLINLGSYNYSGLNGRIEILEAAKAAINKYGTTTSGVRLLNGTNELHIEFEQRMAKFLGVEAVLTYSSCYLANISVLNAFCSKDDVVFSDYLNHQSIRDGLKLSGTEIITFDHKNYQELEELLQNVPRMKRKFIVTDGIFSMDGDVADLANITNLAEKYNVFVIVDDAHATAAYGENGRGTPTKFGLQTKVHILTGSLSKGLPGVGGFAAGNQEVIDYLKFSSNGYIFSASLPAPIIAGLIASLDILEKEPQIQDKLHKNSKYFRDELKDIGLNIMSSESAIIPIVQETRTLTGIFTRALHENGVYANSIVFPAVPRNLPRIRMNMSAQLSKDDMDFALMQIKKVAKELNII